MFWPVIAMTRRAGSASSSRLVGDVAVQPMLSARAAITQADRRLNIEEEGRDDEMSGEWAATVGQYTGVSTPLTVFAPSAPQSSILGDKLIN
jgi:hypothetical protein